MTYWYWLIPVIAAFSGWLCIRVVVYLLFFPVQPKVLLGFRWQGLLAASHQRIAAAIGNLVSREFTFAALEQQLTQPATIQKLMPAVEIHIDTFLREKLPRAMPMLGMLIGDRTIQQLKDIFMAELQTLLPIVIQQYVQALEKDVDAGAIIQQKINALSLAQLEEHLYRPAANRLYHLAWVGAIIGFVTGMLQLGIIWIA
ncbi:uncharacterized membrane protein YheB (UPF0754 family) [Filimonas zeae]|nr:hypothetical protein [Filimonas zeae]MDR6340156.1 uncharacterized membrane protein YheB (UPF0754 family) [Filimonas zeae]